MSVIQGDADIIWDQNDSSTVSDEMEKLTCAVQMYDWGHQGSQSEVALLMQAADKQFVIDETKPYAELWMGVHPNGPSKLVSNGKLLSEKIAESKSSLGDHEGGSLQFLFKVLSEKAKILHSSDPAHYPDNNHKPEMAIALSDFQLLSARSLKEDIFEYMHSSTESVSKAVQQLAVRLKNKNDRSALEALLLRLNNEYPDDVGVFAPLLINYFTLKKEMLFLWDQILLTHISWEVSCVECMACSDNTIRAGLTSKFKDIDTLCSDLTFEMVEPPYFFPKTIGPGIREYAPPVQEFAVHELRSEANELQDIAASSIIIVIKGSAEIHIRAEKVKLIVLSRLKDRDLRNSRRFRCRKNDFNSFRDEPNANALHAYTYIALLTQECVLNLKMRKDLLGTRLHCADSGPDLERPFLNEKNGKRKIKNKTKTGTIRERLICERSSGHHEKAYFLKRFFWKITERMDCSVMTSLQISKRKRKMSRQNTISEVLSLLSLKSSKSREKLFIYEEKKKVKEAGDHQLAKTENLTKTVIHDETENLTSTGIFPD
ncbi:Mannose-6-phosphate isomerase [Dirofilaria immitis]|nr:Mannose-6-phosphate isomerase [Dirofilaria immitis]